MKIAIIADDLTGANDTGVQFARQGASTSVMMALGKGYDHLHDAIVFDTDSRSDPAEEAYQKVKEVCTSIQKYPTPEVVYKKIDSTLRGNIGSEMDAIHNAFQPDFIVMAPAFPKMGRIVKNGCMYVNGMPLHESDMAQDPKNPAIHSGLPTLLKNQTSHPFMMFTIEQLRGDWDTLVHQLREAYRKGVPYLIFDAETEADLDRIILLFNSQKFRIIWSGSAGLASTLSAQLLFNKKKPKELLISSGPVLLVVGSASKPSRQQLDFLLRESDVIGVEMYSDRVLDDLSRTRELKRVCQAAVEMFRNEKKHVVLYLSGKPGKVEQTQKIRSKLGMDAKEVSDTICRSLGQAAAQVICAADIHNTVLTGGDTAKQVCISLGEWGIELIDEIATGVPIGRTTGNRGISVITKAGSFGSEDVLRQSLQALVRIGKGGDTI